MLHSITRFVVGTALGVAVAFLLAFNVLLLWVATGPRPLSILSPYIEASLEPSDKSYSINIGETWLIWDGWKHPIDIRLRDVDVLTREKRHFSNFPEISLGLDLVSLLQGQVLPTSLTITHPVLSLFQNDDRSISFGFSKEAIDMPASETHPGAVLLGEETETVPLAAVLAPLMAPDDTSNLRKLHLVTIVNADVSVADKFKGVVLKAGDVELTVKKSNHGITAFGSATLSYGPYQSPVSAQFALPEGSPTLEGSVNITNVMPAALAGLFTDNAVLNAMQFPVSGEGKIAVNADGILQRLDFTVDGGKGAIATDKLDRPLPVTALHAEGQLADQAHDIQITKFSADFDGMLIDGDGAATLANNDTAVRANLFLKNVPSANVHMLWPPTLAPETREWVTKNISSGTISSSETHVNIALGDLAKPELPKTDIDSTVDMEGATIHYLPEHPPLTDVKASIHIDGKSLAASIESGRYMKQTKMSGGTVAIDDLDLDNPYIKVAFDTETSAKDVVRFLGLPRLKHAKRLGLSEETAEGSISGHAAVGFFFFADDKKDDDITYEVKATVKGITQPGFMDKFDIENADGTVVLNNDAIEFKGSGEVNGATISESDVKYLFKAKGGFDTLIEATATAPVEALPWFGYPAFPFVKGQLGIKANLKEGDNEELSQASIDLTHATMDVDLPAVRWNKPDLEPATIDITAQKKNNVASITSFQIKGRTIDAHGSAELDTNLSDIRLVNVENLKCAGTDLDHVRYEKIEGGFKVDAKGNAADMTAWLGSGGDNTFSFEKFPAVGMNVDVKQVVLGKDRIFNNVKGMLTCDTHQCSSADMAGMTVDNKKFQFRILHNPKGNRQLSVRAQSAGAFLKAVGVFDGMEGGDLSIIGNYDDSGDHSVLRGAIDINEHTVKNAPVLAKILSLASLTGFFDTLQGKGIAFAKLHAPFTLSRDVITFKDAKTHGAAMGMTMEGTITFPKRALNLQGTIIPSYTLNNVVGKVPLVGTMLTGGEGQGIFAARYSVEGSDAAPEVSVNPLSILTPGFLRGVFDIFDQPEKDAGEGN